MINKESLTTEKFLIAKSFKLQMQDYHSFLEKKYIAETYFCFK